MDWVLKASSAWDLTEFGREHFGDLNDTSSIQGNQNREFFSYIIGDGNVNKLNEQKGSTMASSPSSGLSRKTRVHNSGSQNVLCLVDGCTSDLSSCREYHRRHRVCERHSKTPVVLIRGKEQRFCQQCSRFHALGEFDEVKRSCRKRLDGHNRRRRKPQADPLYMNCGSFLTNN